MNFEAALSAIKSGKKCGRAGWNGKNMWVCLNHDDLGNMTLPYIYMHTACGSNVPWLASQSDLLADDWAEIQ